VVYFFITCQARDRKLRQQEKSVGQNLSKLTRRALYETLEELLYQNQGSLPRVLVGATLPRIKLANKSPRYLIGVGVEYSTNEHGPPTQCLWWKNREELSNGYNSE